MGWRDVQAKVASGELDYRRPGKSGFDMFADGFANSFAETMRATRADEAEQRRYDRNRADKLADEERAAAIEAEKERKRKLEERLKEAAEQEKKDAARQRNARKLLQENGRDPNNPNFLGFAMDHLEAYGDNFADANSAFSELNKRITEVGPVQGPLLTREREGYDQATPEEQAQMDNILGVGDTSGVREALRANESGGRTDVVDFNKEDGKDHVGLYQFGQDRLDDYNKANGTSVTVEQLKEMSAEEQEKIADWHFDDIDAYIDSNNLEKYVGQTIGGVTITRSSMIAMAHLGGKSGMKQFLETDGKYNPSDGKTKLSDYARDFAAEDPTTSPAGGVGEATDEQMSAAFEIAAPTVGGLDYDEYAGMSEDKLKRLLAVEKDEAKRTVIQQMLDATKEAPDYAKMSDDELRSRIAAEEDPAVQAVMQKALDARIEAPDYATMPDDELKSRIAAEQDPAIKAAMQQALDARVEQEPFNIADYDDIKDATLMSMIESEKDEAKKLQLKGLLHNRKVVAANTGTEILPGSATYSIVYQAPDGTQQSDIGFAAKSGKGFVIPGVGLVTPIQKPINTDQIKDGLSAFAQIQGKLLDPVVTKRQAYATSIESAAKMVQLVQGNEEILTAVGGTGTRILQRVGAELNALGNLRTLFEEEGYTEDEVLAYIDGTTQSYLADNVGKLSETAQAAALLEAERIKFAFSFAAAQLGQSNTGLSNKDFDNAMKIISQGSTKETFMANLRSQIGSLEQDVSNAIVDLKDSGQFILLEPILPKGTLNDYMLTPEQYLAKQGMSDAYNAIMTTPTSDAVSSVYNRMINVYKSGNLAVDYGNIADAMKQKGFSEEDIKSVMGNNYPKGE